jgi:hypothetical protein
MSIETPWMTSTGPKLLRTSQISTVAIDAVSVPSPGARFVVGATPSDIEFTGPGARSAASNYGAAGADGKTEFVSPPAIRPDAADRSRVTIRGASDADPMDAPRPA